MLEHERRLFLRTLAPLIPVRVVILFLQQW